MTDRVRRAFQADALACAAAGSVLLLACAAAPEMQERTWYWLGSLLSLSATASPAPEAYTLQFSGDRAAIRADCNRGSGALRVELKDGAGAMFFALDPQARLAHYRCSGQRMLSVLYAGESAQLWFEGVHHALPRVRSASGARYSDGAVTFDTKGVLATLRKGEAVLVQDCQAPSV
jgi:membrane-bound inhibitor of C-type lysozyme